MSALDPNHLTILAPPCQHLLERLRACLRGVGDPGLVGLVSVVLTLWGTQNKRNPTPLDRGPPLHLNRV